MSKHSLMAGAVALLLGATSSVYAEVNTKAIAEVAAGKLQVARASWWGFDPVDSTKALQAAIDSGVRKLMIDKMSGPWIVTPIVLRSNQEIEFEKGAEVLAKRGEFRGTGDCLFHADLKENITLTGHGATLRMWRSDYAAAPYAKAEWRHVLSFCSCRNIKVLGLELRESGGDGIYLGTAKAGVTNENILIKDVVCDRNYRQGISVITAENLLIENTVLRNTDGTSPRAGIDFEPNVPNERIVNCVLRNCLSENNGGAGYVAYLSPLDATSAAVSLRLENCKAVGNRGFSCGILTGNTPSRALKGEAALENCVFQASKGPGIELGGNPATGIRILVQNCSILDVAQDRPAANPILFTAGHDATQDLGGVTFAHCLIRDPLGRNPIGLVDDSGHLKVVHVQGNLVLEKGGTKSSRVLTPTLLGQWMPANRLKRYPRVKLDGGAIQLVGTSTTAEQHPIGELRLRGNAHLVMYARRDDQVRLRLYHGQVGNYPGEPVPITVTDWSGKPVARGSVAFQQEGEIQFKAPAAGAYRVEIAPGGNYVRVVNASHPVSFNGQSEPIHLINTAGEFWFYVPAGTREFGIKIFGEGLGEGVRAALYDSRGKRIEEKDDITQARQFEVALAEPSRGEVWRLKTSRASHCHLEDYSIEVLGIPPLLSPGRESVLGQGP